MTTPQPIVGVIQNYEWGDTEFIPRLLGLQPDGRPHAELWLGTHPNGPSVTANGIALADLTGPLPYLLKVLSAAEPLSLQAHPTTEQAQQGYERGVFADPFAKPELLVALTDFDALCGVRPAAHTVELLRWLALDEMAEVVATSGPGAALRGLYRGSLDAGAVIKQCAGRAGREAALVTSLDQRYPGAPSVAVTLLLNRVVLKPGDALRLDAGNLHAYLHGAGVELMQASDNVVRGGLTVKEVNIDLLLEVVDPTPLVNPVIESHDGRYELPDAAVALQRIEAGADHVATGHELALCLNGELLYLSPTTRLTAPATTYVVVAI